MPYCRCRMSRMWLGSSSSREPLNLCYRLLPFSNLFQEFPISTGYVVPQQPVQQAPYMPQQQQQGAALQQQPVYGAQPQQVTYVPAQQIPSTGTPVQYQQPPMYVQAQQAPAGQFPQQAPFPPAQQAPPGVAPGQPYHVTQTTTYSNMPPSFDQAPQQGAHSPFSRAAACHAMRAFQ